MTHTFTTTGAVGPDHRLVIELHPEAPIGIVRVTVTLEGEGPKQIQTLGDLVSSGVAGMYAGRTNLPTKDEEFREWRRKAWAGSHD